MSRACLTIQSLLSRSRPYGGKSRKQRHLWLRVALLENRGLIDHGGHAIGKAIEIQRAMLHVHIRVVEIQAGERVAILQRHIVGLSADDGLPLRAVFQRRD